MKGFWPKDYLFNTNDQQEDHGRCEANDQSKVIMSLLDLFV